ncbi:flagellin, partial [Morganella morganii]|uniref:flagellin n=1 Tax=Morganella morganii TaxID=582 RepID=UPI0021D1DC4D
FNGIKVLSKDQTLSIQVGANDGQTIDINLGQMDTGTLGLDGFSIMNMVATSQVTEGMQVVDGANKYNLDADDVTAIETELFGATGTGGKMYAYTDEATGKTAYIGVAADGTWKSVTADIDDTDPDNLVLDLGTAAAVDAATDPVVKSLTTLQTMDDALAMVDEMRSGLGASQNRFNSVISNLDNTVINLSESRARILDADFAVEVSNMSRANILQSAGTTVLAQANQVPQNVLTLLR